MTRRFHASSKFIRREKIHISREFTYCGKIFMPRKRTYTDKERAIFVHRPQHASFILMKNKYQEEHQRLRQKRHQYRINIYLFILASNEEYPEDFIYKAQGISFIC